MSMLLFNGLEIKSNEHFLVLSNKIRCSEPFPITIFNGKIKYYATWNFITNIVFLDNEIIKPTILMQSLDVSENTELKSEYNIKIVNIKPRDDGHTEVTLELQNGEEVMTDG
ncbi:MAG: hypothetical protein ABFC34_01500 [Methanobacterium sp.]